MSVVEQIPAREGILSLPENSISMVFADPPYDTDQPYQWLTCIVDRLTRHGSLYLCCQWQRSGCYQEAIEACGLKIQTRITWRRNKGRGAKRNWKSLSEDIWFATKTQDYTFHVERVMQRKEVKATYKNPDGSPRGWWMENGKAVRATHPGNVWDDTPPFWKMPEYRRHPHQKPESLVERCILASTEPGELVVDPFVGSGTTGAVAVRLGRRFKGFETSAKWAQIARDRIAEHRTSASEGAQGVDVDQGEGRP